MEHGSELMFSGIVCTFCSISGTRRIIFDNIIAIGHERGKKDRIVTIKRENIRGHL